MHFDSLFYKHVRNFWLGHHSKVMRPVVVGVSGGVDSCLLLVFAASLKREGLLKEVRALTVHHHTRDGQNEDVSLVEKLARRLGVEFSVLHRQGEIPRGDLENILRKQRRELLLGDLKNGEELWLAQHLDDSWEWAQLQAARSSEISLGIPLKNGPIWRPFLCVTRSQIEREAKKLGLEWREDPSNATDSYARALFRQQLHPLIKKQHPQFLKHYARRSQRLAQKLGVALKSHSLVEEYSSDEAILLKGMPTELDVINAIKKLSRSGRGTLTREVPKILKAQQNGKHGPFTVSGGVKIWAYGQWLLITSAQFKTADHLPLTPEWMSWTKAEFQKLISQYLSLGSLQHAPFWVSFDPDQKHRNVLVPSGIDPLWPVMTGQRAVPVISAQKLLARWKDENLILRLAPLWPLKAIGDRG